MAQVFDHLSPLLASWRMLWSTCLLTSVVIRTVVTDGTVSQTWSLQNCFQKRSRSMSYKPAEMGSCHISCICRWTTADHEPRNQHVSVNKIWRQIATTACM